ncbi:amidase [Ureibacillus massiliensis 4400831 = CIP 108448 = CCUG 49529]|uniref:Amidase n=1 Tax=Ureibacillus massiliensis 4400831 = CIP 108448 = CCUG 49529 TaxID=1211035 RepID=A0A0A3J306_9BACL|nr:amidase domain-containing protein [Ureibacillus massiliensis]KGR91271.1 amidase [Ureibacillus massiliensis 4400831 = CIP 108448 = CCUG 49529]
MATYYNRNAAVQYARTWWNGRNPVYPSFVDDCTNFISQCLRAGGAPMTGAPNRGRGWWITDGWQTGRPGQFARETWSYSWSVSHALRLYLENATSGLTATRVNSPSELTVGDVIFYDFEGDGRTNHSTIVTSMINGVPYIHAHTVNSENRHYDYRNSLAYTPNTQYFYYKIDDVFN